MKVGRWVEAVEHRVPAPAAHLYALVADPARHREFDGSGGVVGLTAVSATSRPLRVGDTFDMDMDLRGKYRMTSTVITASPGVEFAWQSRPHRDEARWRQMFGGRIWRYEFTPDGDGTIVRESWDLGAEPMRWWMIAARPVAREAMRKSLHRMAILVTGESDGAG